MDHQPFLRAIRAKPEDDLPRLVYADALEESGASERAEFIRVQVALANTPEHDPQFRLLEDREHELLGKNERAWMGNPSVTPQEWAWHRGFVDEVINVERSLLALQDCLNDQVVTKLEVTETTDNEASFQLPLDEWSSDLRTLTLHGETDSSRWRECLDRPTCGLRALHSRDSGDRAILNLVRFGELRQQLTSYRMYNPIGMNAELELRYYQDLAELFENGSLTDLRLVDAMSSVDFIPEQLFQLLRSNATRNLTSLDLSYSPIAPGTYRPFESSPAQLQTLNIAGTPLASISLKPLMEARSTQTLKSLEVNGTGSARTNLEAVANSRFWSQAERFSASQGTIQASTFEPITKCGSLNLRHLDLGGNYLRADGVRYLCEAPWADSLTFLSLWQNSLDDESCEVIAKSGRFKNLRSLQLTQNNASQRDSNGEQITDRGIIALCKSPALANLRMLALGHNNVGDASFREIFHAPFTLSALHLNRCEITKYAILTIAHRPKLARLNTLDLSDNPELGGLALMPLAMSEFLSPLCELDVSGIELNQKVIDVLRKRLGRRFTYSG